MALLKFFLAILMMFAPMTVWAVPPADVPLTKIIAETGASFRWDPYLEIGELSFRGDIVRFKIGDPFIVINFRKKVAPVTVKRDTAGGIVFSVTAADSIKSLFKVKETDTYSMKIKAIIIDPGHGGKDPGAIGHHIFTGKPVVLKEKDVVLTVAKGLYSLLRARYPEKEIILTRHTDKYITLEGRTQIANRVSLKKNEAMIFISIHANASLNPHSKGFEIWYLPPGYRRKLIDPNSLAHDQKDVAPILNSMLEEEFTVESVLLAKQIESGLIRQVGDKIEDRGLKEESWFVVRNAKMPAVLVELGFVTNRDEAKIMGNKVYLKKMSEGIYNGVQSFIHHFEVSK